MSQILIKDVNTPADFSWSAVFCDTNEKLKNYLKQDSIILISADSYNTDNILFNTIKLTFPETVIGVIGLENETKFVKGLSYDAIDDFISSCIRKRYSIVDRRELLDAYLEFINSIS